MVLSKASIVPPAATVSNQSPTGDPPFVDAAGLNCMHCVSPCDYALPIFPRIAGQYCRSRVWSGVYGPASQRGRAHATFVVRTQSARRAIRPRSRSRAAAARLDLKNCQREAWLASAAKPSRTGASSHIGASTGIAISVCVRVSKAVTSSATSGHPPPEQNSLGAVPRWSRA